MTFRHVVIEIGDSRTRGQGDDDTSGPYAPSAYGVRGFADRACVLAGMASAKFGAGGTGLETWDQPDDLYWDLAAEMGGTIGLISLGVNRGPETGAQLLAKLQIIVDLTVGIGLLPIVCTIPPYLDYGDPANGDVARPNCNDGLRDARLPRSVATADIASASEGDATGAISLNGGWWRSDAGVGPFGTDLHETSRGAVAEAIVVADALTRVAAGERGFLSQSAEL